MPVSNISPPPPSRERLLHHNNNHHLYERTTTTATTKASLFTAYRPRLLYSALFSWNTVTCGKFIAPFLEDISPALFSDGVVGMTLAVQYAIVAMFAGWGGRLADLEERRCQQNYHIRLSQQRQRQHSSSLDDNYQHGNNFISGGGGGCCWGVGRLKVLSFSIVLGTVAVLGHVVPSLYTQYCTSTLSSNNNNGIEEQTVIIQFPYEVAWHISMRCVYALSLSIMAPCVDGLALAHLDCIDGASQADFGKERMYGAAFWGLGSLCAGIGIDHFGFGFVYVMTVVTALVSFVAIGVYLIGLRRDTTGAFLMTAATTNAAVTTTAAAPSSSPSSSLLAVVGEEEWNGNTYMHTVDDEQRRRQTQTSRSSSSSPNTSSNNEQAEETESDNNTSSMQLFSLFCQTGYGKALLFFVFSLAVGISIVDNLAFIFFDSLGSSNTMNGLTVVFTVLFEIPIFYLAPRFLHNHGPGKLLLAAGIAYIVRVIGYTVAPHMSVVLMLETLHGISYAGGKAGSVEYIAQIAPKGYEATGQGILIFVNYIGIVAGLFAGGHIQEALGPRAMFYVMALIVALGTVVLFVAEICLDAPPKRDNNGEDNGDNNVDETTRLIKSESGCSSGSYADRAAENFMRKNLKYDSLNKYVKDW